MEKKIHIVKPGHAKSLCGKEKKLVSHLSEAWGHWGPEGQGHKEVCKTCVRASKRVYR